MNIGERIRLRIKDEASKRYRDGGPRVTASLGVANMDDNPDSPGSLNNLADEALYCAKQNGRNRVVNWASMKDVEDANQSAANLPQTDVPVDPQVAGLQERIIELEEIASKFSSDLEYSKSYDELTGLPNQLLFYDRVHQAIDRGIRHDQIVAVLILDIEMFSQINEGLGRAGGDELLKLIAERLNSLMRRTDDASRLSVSRFGGDEFALMLTDIQNKNQVTWAIKRFLDVINQPMMIDDKTIYLTCRVGVSLYPTDADDVDGLLNNAMSAKQYVKKYGSELGYQFFDQSVQALSVKHLHLEDELRQAVKKEEWVLHYQPKLSIKDQKIIGVEALVRWNHPQKGLLGPFEFIEFAEQRGHILDIGNWVIKEACRQIQDWIQKGVPTCKIAINLSGIQLVHPDIVETVFAYLKQYDVPPRLLEIEVTETMLMNNLEKAIESLGRFHARGISIAIDDFGTGYSSLSYLKSLPIDSLKIDRVFIKDICDDENDQKIVKTVISMAHSMEMGVIAEGIEDTDQLALLRDLSVDEFQGYLFSKPLPVSDLNAMLLNPPEWPESDQKVVRLRS